MPFIRRAVLSAALSAAFVVPSCLLAQTGSYAPLVLRLPASARDLSMGNVGVASRDDDVLFYNPAQLVAARGTSVSLEQFSANAHGGALSSVARVGNGGIAVGATLAEFESAQLDYPMSRATMLGQGVNDGTSANLVLGIGQVFKGTNLGIAAKYVDENFAGTRRGLGAVDLGVSRSFFGTAFGLAVQNIGPTFDPGVSSVSSPGGFGTPILRSSVPLPLRTTLGAARATQAGPFDVYGTAALSLLRDDFFAPAGGVEIGYSWLDGYDILLRAGARRPERGENPMTAGLGLAIDRISIDYAVEALSGSRFAHRIGLRVK
jgi:hypothetical protein